ncbi:hypothetical protein ARMGADRAFT_892156, partial [Armillaria gallica]
WIACCHHPHKIIIDPELVKILKMLYSQVNIVSPSTISHDIQDMHAISKKNIALALQSTCGRLHFAIDGWSSPNVISYLGVTITHCIKGVVEEFLLDFICLMESNTGEYLIQKFVKVLNDLGVAHK